LLSFIFPELEKTLSDKEKEEFLFYTARFQSRLTVPYDLFKELAAVLDRFLKYNESTIIFPDLVYVDSETLRVFENYYRYFPENAQDIIVGFRTDIVDKEDNNGIIWERSTGTVQYFVGSFAIHPTTKLVILSNASTVAGNETGTWKQMNTPNDEEKFYNSLQPGMTTVETKKAIKVMSRSYAGYSHRAVIKMGLRVLDYCDLEDGALKSSIYGLIGSSSNFYQFTHHENPVFDQFLVHNLVKGFENESRPEVRSALLYRITFAYAERMGNTEKALAWAEKTVDNALKNNVDEITYNYHLAWSYIVRADVYAHAEKFEEFVADSKTAYAILEKGIAQLEKNKNNQYNYWLIDYRLSLFNMSIHQIYTGDELNEYDHSRVWYKKMFDIMKVMPKILLFDTFHWVDYHRNKFELAKALEAAQEGIVDAVELKHGQIYVYLFCAADVSYRMGDPYKAKGFFESAKGYRPIYGDLFNDVSLSYVIANCEVRMGAYEKAIALYNDELRAAKSKAYKIKLNAQLAWVAALTNNKERFEENINKTINLAVNYGEKNLLLKVAALAGHGLYKMNYKQEAKEAYDIALSFFNSLNQDNKQLNAGYVLDLYTGFMMVNGYDEKMTAEALKQVPKALDDLENWWCLPKLDTFVTLFLDNNTSHSDTVLLEGIATFKKAILQRVDSIETITTV